MKKLLTLGLVLFAASFTAEAKTFKMGADTPFVSITIPDSWEADGDAEVIAGSNYGAFLSAETAAGSEMAPLIDKAVDFLTEQGVVIDEKTIEKNQKEINGITTTIITATGKDKDGPASIGLIVSLAAENKVLLLTYWGPVEENKDLVADLGTIIGSIKALK